MIKEHLPGRLGRRSALSLVLSTTLISLLLLVLLISPTVAHGIDWYRTHGIEGVARKTGVSQFIDWKPSVTWRLATPESYGIDSARLDTLSRELEERHTRAFVVVKDGSLIHEWYASGSGFNDTHSTSALGKAITGSMALMAAVDQGYIKLDDPAWKYIPSWRDDPQKSRITIAQLASHTSGLDNVEFRDDVTPQWKLTYYLNKDMRFPMALSQTPVIVEPGTRYSYSGVGYYVLAYALTRSLQQSPEPDIYTLLDNRIMKPLAIPEEAWEISYGESYELDGMTLYAAGSGARYTARAIATIGQLMLNGGQWNGQQILSPESVKSAIFYEPATGDTFMENTTLLSGFGWISNANGHYSSLPRDAFFGIGGGHQVLLVVPSLDLVMVRVGGPLADESDYANSLELMDEFLLTPLMQALD